MFVIEYYKMYVRPNGLMTDSKAAARLFKDEFEAEAYILNEMLPVVPNPNVETRQPIKIVEAETKVVLHKTGKTVKEF